MDSDVIHDLIDKKEHIETAARALKAISHPLRLKILCVVGDQEVCVQDIVDAVGTSQSNISQHLGILRDKGVLQTRKDANRVFYRVADQRGKHRHNCCQPQRAHIDALHHRVVDEGAIFLQRPRSRLAFEGLDEDRDQRQQKKQHDEDQGRADQQEDRACLTV